MLDNGVTYAFTSLLSKNTYNLVLGKNPWPEKVIVLGLTKGINALDITLEPCDSSSICSTIEVLRPVLARSVLVVVVVLSTRLNALPVPTPIDTLVLITPDHCVSQAFQTVPIEFRLFAKTVS